MMSDHLSIIFTYKVYVIIFAGKFTYQVLPAFPASPVNPASPASPANLLQLDPVELSKHSLVIIIDTISFVSIVYDRPGRIVLLWPTSTRSIPL